MIAAFTRLTYVAHCLAADVHQQHDQAHDQETHDKRNYEACDINDARLVEFELRIWKQFAVIEHELPNRMQLEELARLVANTDELGTECEFTRVLDAAYRRKR